MARCEICGVEQYPYNTLIRYTAGARKHFFCSQAHADLFASLPPALPVAEARTEQVVEEAVTAERQVELDEAQAEGREPAPKRKGRPPGSKNRKPSVKSS